MRRESRALAALAGTDVPHPALIAAEPDEAVIGAAFFLMESIDGYNVTLELPPAFVSDAAAQHEIGLSMADAIAALGRIDPEEQGIADLGRWDGWGERQVPRWRKQLDSYASFEGYRGPDIPGVDEVGEWLDSNRPTDLRPGLIHGDFHFANVLIHPSEPRVAAIVDWELTTIGDPLLDLGHLLACWPNRARGRGDPDRARRPADDRRGRLPVRSGQRSRPVRVDLVPGARLLSAGADPRRHACAGVRRVGARGDRQPAPRAHAGACSHRPPTSSPGSGRSDRSMQPMRLRSVVTGRRE